MKYKKIVEIKAGTSPDFLVIGHPKCFSQYLAHARSLQFTQKPDYHYLKTILISCMKQLRIVNDRRFDWSNNHPGQSRTKVTTTSTRPVHGSVIQCPHK